MDSTENSQHDVLWFIETIRELRSQLNDEEFQALCHWIKFVADEQPVAH